MKLRYLLSLAGCCIVPLCAFVYAEAQDTALTRAEAVKILLINRTDHVPLFENLNQFPDVPSGHPYERFLLAGERYGIISADSYTHLLRPDGIVNRAQFLKMISLTYGLSENLPYSYTDVKKSDWFSAYAGLAQTYGLFSTKGKLEPTAAVTRDDAVLTLSAMKQAMSAPEDKAEQELAKDQAKNKLDVYVVISSKRTKTVFGDVQPMHAAPALAQTPEAKLSELRQEILVLVNAERAKVKAKPLTINPMLNGSAQAYAEKMAHDGFFSHVTPDGKTFKDRIRDSGYYDRSYSESCSCIRGYALGENLARGQRTPKEAVEAWMKSQSHREALLSPDYTDTGLGISAGLWVEHFGGILEPSEMAKK